MIASGDRSICSGSVWTCPYCDVPSTYDVALLVSENLPMRFCFLLCGGIGVDSDTVWNDMHTSTAARMVSCSTALFSTQPCCLHHPLISNSRNILLHQLIVFIEASYSCGWYTLLQSLKNFNSTDSYNLHKSICHVTTAFFIKLFVGRLN